MKLHVHLALSAGALLSVHAWAQAPVPSKVQITWDRYYDYGQMKEQMERIAAAYPDLVELRSIGRSHQGREMLVAIVNSPKSGRHEDKPAIWIDGNIHGNEVQAGEVVLYTLWKLAASYGHNERLTQLIDQRSFYLMPMVNPDGRQFWFDQANTPHSSRHNHRPIDNDRDGRTDEDPPDDLDNDGHITQMWKIDPRGRWVRSQTDDRVFVRLRDDQSPAPGVQTWTSLGEEGIDNDGDGRFNEDGTFGDDMNRNFPGDWQPEYIQGGAGPFPLSSPETRCAAEFILAHPNIAAVQSYHNTGGMILRGPGAKQRERMYPGEDLRVYDELARTGEQMLPYYRYLVIFSDLYRVHGGTLCWTGETLGIYSFTNELWTTGKYFQRDGGMNDEQQWLWRDRLAFGELFSPYREHVHAQHGPVLIGGPNKWSSRVTPTFMLEEECHRNFAFTMYHADQMPIVEFGRSEVREVEAGPAGQRLWRIRLEVNNTRLMPTRSAVARRERIGWPDLLEAAVPNGKVLSVSRLDNWSDLKPTLMLTDGRREPERLLLNGGVPGRGSVVVEYLVEGAAGSSFDLRYTSSWARPAQASIKLESPPQ